MANIKERPRVPLPLYLVLRETYRHYLEYRNLVMSPTQTSNDRGLICSSVVCEQGVIDHGYYIYDDSEIAKGRVNVAISFWDLHGSLKRLSVRKREAVFYNVILDWRQKDVAERMGISTVSVGQYVQAAMEQLAVALDLQQTVTLFEDEVVTV